jgi:hypothetical protein
MDLDPAIFVIDFQDASKKLILGWSTGCKTEIFPERIKCVYRHPPPSPHPTVLTKFFCLLFFEGTFTSFFKDKKSKSHKKEGIKVFLTIFA